MSSTSCQVCGQDSPGQVVVGCARCASLHHLDCWRYVGHCSTYGCGSEFTAEELAAMGKNVADFVAEPTHETPGPAETCASCRRRWKLEKGARCHGCGRIYHGSCWEANGGCLQFTCRAAMRRVEEEGHTVVSGLGDANCLVCTKTTHEEESVLCSSCGRSYHLDCWVPNRGCVRFDCREQGSGDGIESPPPPGPREVENRAEELQRLHRHWDSRRSFAEALLGFFFGDDDD